MAVKFYNDQGKWDLLGDNLPIFFICDAIQFPDMIHSLKPSSGTIKQDPNRVFEFFFGTPEPTNMPVHIYSNLGTPASYHRMDGISGHAFMVVNSDGKLSSPSSAGSAARESRTSTATPRQGSFNCLQDDLNGAIVAGEDPRVGFELPI